MKVVIFGACGQLGRELSSLLPEKNLKVYPFLITQADVTNFSQLKNIVGELRPDVIINASAYNAVDKAQEEPDTAFEINSVGPYNLAALSSKHGSILIHYSTDFVFDGTKNAPYTEEDAPCPLSIYGKSKLLGEFSVQWAAKRSYVIRTSCLYGRFGENFLTRLIANAKKEKTINLPDDLIGSPTYAKDLAMATKAVLDRNPPFGLYHIVNTGSCSRYEWAKTFLTEIGAKIDIQPVPFSKINYKAPRPRFTALAPDRIKTFGISMRTWQDALKEYVRDTKQI